MKRFTTAVCLLVLLFGLSACADSAPAPEPAAAPAEDATAGEEAGARTGLTFTTSDLDGNEIDQSIFAAAPVTMINVWATYCPPCLREMPDLGELAAEYAGQVQVIGLVIDIQDQRGLIDEAQLELALEIIETTGADYQHLIYSPELIDGLLRVVSAVPTSFFVDREGYFLVQPVVGALEKAQWNAAFEELLALVEED